MKLNRTFRAQLGLVLLLLFVGYNIVSMMRQTGLQGPTDQATEKFSVYLTRFECLRDTLQYHPFAGYVDDGGWFQAQYALAPTVIAQGFEFPVVVGNFSEDSSANKTRAENELELLIDCGHGVRLYRGSNPE